MSRKVGINRRSFMQSAAVAAAAPAPAELGSSSSKRDEVPAEPPLKVGLVGCGGRGTGAVANAIESAPNIEVTVLADGVQANPY